MKSWLMTLPLLLVGGAAMAQGDAGAGTAAQEAVAAQEQVQVQSQTQTQVKAPSKAAKTRPSKGGDIRHCLDRKTNQAVHRCAASKRGK